MLFKWVVTATRADRLLKNRSEIDLKQSEVALCRIFRPIVR